MFLSQKVRNMVVSTQLAHMEISFYLLPGYKVTVYRDLLLQIWDHGAKQTEGLTEVCSSLISINSDGEKLLQGPDEAEGTLPE